MYLAIARVTLAIPGASSLKDKRQVVRKLLDRARARFEVAASEVADHDRWQRAVLGFALVGGERAAVAERLDALLRLVEGLGVAPVLEVERAVCPAGEVLDGPVRTLAEAERAKWEEER